MTNRQKPEQSSTTDGAKRPKKAPVWGKGVIPRNTTSRALPRASGVDKALIANREGDYFTK